MRISRNSLRIFLSFVLGVAFSIAACTARRSPEQGPGEHPILPIPLAGEAASSDAEFSGLAWYRDYLILLPQYPARFGTGDGKLFEIAKADLVDFIDGKNRLPITPKEIAFRAPGLAQHLPGFEGYEAIAFVDDLVFLTIESKQGTMLGSLVKGAVLPDLSAIEVDPATMVSIPHQADLLNISDEAIVPLQDKILTIYEANGARANPRPVAHFFDLRPAAIGTLTFPGVAYRITDATPPDDAGRFWAINCLWQGDPSVLGDSDPLELRFGKGPTHGRLPQVERLIEFQYADTGITLTNTPPIQLVLQNAAARNWEGIARLDSRGFIIVTDRYPETILAFVER